MSSGFLKLDNAKGKEEERIFKEHARRKLS